MNNIPEINIDFEDKEDLYINSFGRAGIDMLVEKNSRKQELTFSPQNLILF